MSEEDIKALKNSFEILQEIQWALYKRARKEKDYGLSCEFELFAQDMEKGLMKMAFILK